MKRTKRLFKTLLSLTLSVATMIGVASPVLAAGNVTVVDSGQVLEPNELVITDKPERKGWSYEVLGNDTETHYYESGNIWGCYDPSYSSVSVDFKNPTSANGMNIHFNYVGTYQGKNIGANIKVRNIVPWSGDKHSKSPYATVNFCESMFSGFWYINISEMELDYEFFYEGTNTPINIAAYMSFNSLNTGEYVVYKSQPNTDIQVVKDNHIGHRNLNTQFGSLIGCIGTSNDFYDAFGHEGFNRNSVTMSITGQSNDFIIGRDNWVPEVWIAPSTTPITIYRPNPPEETITYQKRYIGEETSLITTQEVNTMGVDTIEKYRSFSLENTIPSELDYVSAKVVDEAGNEISGSLNYDTASRKVTYNFTSEYLQNSMRYAGEKYSLVITAKLNNNAKGKLAINDDSTSVINSVTQTTNTVVVAPIYKIDTKVTNGAISNSITEIDANTNRTISWQSNPGYDVTKILIDGNEIAISDVKRGSYTFSNIADNHTVEVICTPSVASITLTKEINANDILWANGDPTFLFEVKGTDITGKAHTYYRTVRFTKNYVDMNSNNGVVTLSTYIDNLVAGNYTATEKDGIRYTFGSIKDITAGSAANQTVAFDLINHNDGAATYVNAHTRYDKTSHTDLVTNQVSR